MTLVTPALGTPASGNLTNCTFPTLNQNTTGSAASLSVSGQTGLFSVTGLASVNRIKTVRDAADTILELGGSYTPTGTWTSMTMVTPALGTPASGALTNCTSIPAGQLTGTVPAAQMPALTGDVTTSAGAVATTLGNNFKLSSVGITIDGGGSTVTTGVKGYVRVVYGGTITAWSIIAEGASPTCTFDVWKITGGTALPTVTNTIMGTKPALTTGNTIRSTTRTSWTTSITANDVLGFNLDAVTVATRITFQLEVTKT